MGSIKRIIGKINKGNIKKTIRYMKKNGIIGVINKITSDIHATNQYNEWFLSHRIGVEEADKQRMQILEYNPRISILVPAYHTPLPFMIQMLDSVTSQTYSNWELCISIGSPNDIEIEKLLAKKSKEDERIKYRKLDANSGISINTNAALELATGEYVGLLDHDDILEPDALFEVAKCLQNGRIDVAYTDEDKVNESLTQYMSPYFKPDFSIDLLRCQNYITHLFVVKKAILIHVGGFDSIYDGAQDYDVILKCTEQANQIYHIPKVLYHWRMTKGSTAENPESKMYCYEAGRQAVEQNLRRLGIRGSVKHAELLGRYHTTYEVTAKPLISVIVSYASDIQGNKRQAYIEELKKKETDLNLEFIFVKDEFPESAFNQGAKQANGEYLLFVKSDIYPINSGGVREMLGIASREDVGAVGSKILCHNQVIKDAGLIIGGPNHVEHAFRGENAKAHSYMNRAEQNGNYSAISSDVMMIKKELFESLNGFQVGKKQQHPRVRQQREYTQVEFCNRIREKGYLITYCAFSEWLESSTQNEEKCSEESTNQQFAWDRFQQEDPFYNKNMSLTHLFTIDS